MTPHPSMGNPYNPYPARPPEVNGVLGTQILGSKGPSSQVFGCLG